MKYLYTIILISIVMAINSQVYVKNTGLNVSSGEPTDTPILYETEVVWDAAGKKLYFWDRYANKWSDYASLVIDTLNVDTCKLSYAKSLSYFVYDSNIDFISYQAEDSVKLIRDSKNYPRGDPFYYNWTVNAKIVGHYIQQHQLRMYRCKFYNNVEFPDFGIESRMERLYFYENTNANPVMPSSWEKAPYLRYFYFKKNGWTTAECDALINQIAGYLENGMGTSYTGNKTMYLSGTGTGENETITVADFLSNGWTQPTSTSIIKTINGKLFTVYFNP